MVSEIAVKFRAEGVCYGVRFSQRPFLEEFVSPRGRFSQRPRRNRGFLGVVGGVSESHCHNAQAFYN